MFVTVTLNYVTCRAKTTFCVGVNYSLLLSEKRRNWNGFSQSANASIFAEYSQLVATFHNLFISVGTLIWQRANEKKRA